MTSPLPAAGARPRRSRLRLAWQVVSWGVVLALGALLVVFRPVSLGGTTTYTFVVGVSMEPTLRTGDLAIVVPQDTYAVGDIVSFHPSAAPDGQIIHRIVAGDASGWTTQGDSRATADPDVTPSAELVGKAVVIVPQAAWVLNAIRQPLVLGALAAVVVVSTLWDLMKRRERRDPAG